MNDNEKERMKEIRRRVREFANRELTPEVIKKYEDEKEYPDDIRKRAAKELLPLLDNTMSKAVAIEETCRVNTGLGITVFEQPLFGSDLIALYGTEKQKSEILEPVKRGELILGFGVTEARGGSDVASITTTAEKKDGYFLLNGSKMFITNGNVADYIIILARTSPPEEKKHRGMSLLIVDTKLKGFSANRLTGKMGVRASVTSELLFENVKVPVDMLLGEEGRGFYEAMDYFNRSRINVAAMSLGIAQGALDQLIQHITEAKKVDSSAFSDEGILFDLSNLATQIYMARNITYSAASVIDFGSPDQMITSMAKKSAGETAVHVSREVAKLLGPRGMTGPAEAFFRDSKIMDIWEGASEIENLVIGRSLMKRGGALYE